MSASVVTPGNFDGVHLGHRALVRAALATAGRLGVRSVAMFFDPHPTSFFAPERAPALLTSPMRRAELLRSMGLNGVDVRAFDATFAGQSPEEFVRRVLIGDHHARAVVVGADFRFGKDRRGDITLLRTMAAEGGFDVEIVDPVTAEGAVVSSTRVRELVARGDVADAARLLGRVHDVDGEVVRGDARGRTIGFPTANLRCDDVLLPADGVYAVRARVGDRLFDGVANLGVRPTFGAGRSVEVHLLDASLDLYGQRLRVGFVARVRGEQRFSGVDELRAQIARDVGSARGILVREPSERLRWM